MGTHFIFPTHPLRSAAVEEMFADQFEAVQQAGYSTSLCPDSVIHNNKPLRNVPACATVIYRGWMLNATEYARLSQAVDFASATLLTSTSAIFGDAPPAQLVSAHHGIYARNTGFRSRSGLGVGTAVTGLGGVFHQGLREVAEDVARLHCPRPVGDRSRGRRDGAIRGEIEGGLCVRRVVQFVTDSERRYFVLDGKAFSHDGQPVPALVEQVAPRIPSPVFLG